MKKIISVTTLSLLVFSLQVFAQTNADREAVKRTVLNYAEGWYEGNADKMESALHPDLAKRRVNSNGKGESRLDELSAMGLVQLTRPGYGKQTPKEEQQKNLVILDITENIATVKLEMHDWVDYMHLGKFNGKWVIINVLWEWKPKKS